MRLLFEGGDYNIQGLAGGGEGGDYSRAASDRGNTVPFFIRIIFLLALVCTLFLGANRCVKRCENNLV